MSQMDELDTADIRTRTALPDMSALQSQYAEQLAPFLPSGTAATIAKWIVELRVKFVVARPRRSKLGDYRVGHGGESHRISVNGDLNPYAFLVTTVHEFAHLGCYLKHQNTVAPHGPEWKAVYTDMLRPMVGRGVFPDDLSRALRHHIQNPKASSCSCPVLTRALAKYDEVPAVFLGDLKAGDEFVFNGEAFRYIKKRRTRCLCRCMNRGTDYLISMDAPVLPLSAKA